MASAEEFFGTQPRGQISPEQFFGGSDPQLYEPETEEEKIGFLDRMYNNVKKRSDMLQEITSAVQSGEQSFAEGVLQVAGKVGAGSVMDLLGEGVSAAGRGVVAITPESIRSGVGRAATEFLNTDVGKAGLEAAANGVRNWEYFRVNNPRAARNIEAVVDIGLLAAPPSRAARPVGPMPQSLLGRTASTVRTAAQTQDAATRTRFVDDLIRPERSAAVKVDEVARTTEQGLLRNKVVALSPEEQRMASVANSIPEVSPSNSLQGNYRAIDAELGREADRLLQTLQQSGAPIAQQEVDAALSLAQLRLANSPVLVGDAAKTADRLVTEAQRIVASNPPTSAGLLQSRRQFDQFIYSQKGDRIFDPAMENALSMSVREVRQTLNALIDAKNPSIGVQTSLARQSAMYRALDNIAPKAADEYSNAALRAWQNAMRILPLRGEFNQIMATVAGVGGLGAAAKFAPMFTSLAAGSLGLYLGGKMVMSATAKRAVARLIGQVDEALKVATDADMIRQLRLDRATLLEITEQEQE